MSYQNKVISAMILAAGFGTRLKDLTLNTPKPLIKVHEIAVIDRIIANLLACNIKEIFINTHYLYQKIYDHIWHKYPNYNIKLIHEPDILETGGGILNIMQLYDKNELLIYNGDIILPRINDLKKLIDNWHNDYMNMLLLLKHKNGLVYPCTNGQFDLKKQHIVRSLDKKKMQYINTGVYIISDKAFDYLPPNHSKKFSITELWFLSNNDNYKLYRFYGSIAQDEWFDIGTLEGLHQAELFLKQQKI